MEEGWYRPLKMQARLASKASILLTIIFIFFFVLYPKKWFEMTCNKTDNIRKKISEGFWVRDRGRRMGICLFLAVSYELEYAFWTLSLPGSGGWFQLHEHKLFLFWLTLWLGISGKISTLITLTWPGSFLVHWVPLGPALWVSLQEAGSLG